MNEKKLKNTIDIIFVGPWERVVSNIGSNYNLDEYFKKFKDNKHVKQLIYSSSDEPGTVSCNYFDSIISNHYNSSEIYNSGLIYSLNTQAAIKKCKSKFLIRVRSDIYIKNINIVIDELLSNKDKFIIDDYINHTNLIPYYFSDFLIGVKLTDAKLMFSRFDRIKPTKIKFFSLSPFKYLTAGFFLKNFTYNEYYIWTNLLKNLGVITKIKKMSMLNGKDFNHAQKLLKNRFILINRSSIFKDTNKFKFNNIFNIIFFKNNILDQSLQKRLLRFLISIFLFFWRTFLIFRSWISFK